MSTASAPHAFGSLVFLARWSVVEIIVLGEECMSSMSAQKAARGAARPCIERHQDRYFFTNGSDQMNEWALRVSAHLTSNAYA